MANLGQTTQYNPTQLVRGLRSGLMRPNSSFSNPRNFEWLIFPPFVWTRRRTSENHESNRWEKVFFSLFGLIRVKLEIEWFHVESYHAFLSHEQTPVTSCQRKTFFGIPLKKNTGANAKSMWGSHPPFVIRIDFFLLLVNDGCLWRSWWIVLFRMFQYEYLYCSTTKVIVHSPFLLSRFDSRVLECMDPMRCDRLLVKDMQHRHPSVDGNQSLKTSSSRNNKQKVIAGGSKNLIPSPIIVIFNFHWGFLHSLQ